MNNNDLVKLFQFCPICTEPLQPHLLHKESGAKFCPNCGDFMVQRWRGQEPLIIFKKFDGRVRQSPYSKGKPGCKIRCDQTGKVFSSIKSIVREMGLNQGNLSRHINGHAQYSHVKGYTFSVISE